MLKQLVLPNIFNSFVSSCINYILIQVLSWRPRALYFPNFATAEQCESVIKMAKPGLKPSTLALRKGETAESTQGIRTRYGLFDCLPFEFI